MRKQPPSPSVGERERSVLFCSCLSARGGLASVSNDIVAPPSAPIYRLKCTILRFAHARAQSFSVYRAPGNPCRRVDVGSSLVEPVPPEVLHVLFLTIHVPLRLLALQCAVLSTKLDILRSRQLKVSVRRAPGSPCRHLDAGNSLFEPMAPSFPRFCLGVL